eukprot:gene1295-4218_t
MAAGPLRLDAPPGVPEINQALQALGVPDDAWAALAYATSEGRGLIPHGRRCPHGFYESVAPREREPAHQRKRRHSPALERAPRRPRNERGASAHRSRRRRDRSTG